MMRVYCEVNEPDKVRVKLTLTMELGELRDLCKQLGDQWPSWRFGALLKKVLSKVETVVGDEEFLA